MSILHSRPPGCIQAGCDKVMLAELHHRLSNELMAALSAVRQARRSLPEASDSGSMLDHAAFRLENFCRIHEILDHNRPHAALSDRLESLCRATAQSRAAAKGVLVVLSAEEVAVDSDTAWTVCVVASELMTNALKHAFADDAPGLIAVELRECAAGLSLTVADNGSGPTRPGHPCAPVLGLGSKILAELARRVGGTLTHEQRLTGTSVTLTVPIERTIQ
jgi:two-component sensor histidine kinase